MRFNITSQAIGLDIRSDEIVAVWMKKHGRKIAVEQLFSEGLDAGLDRVRALQNLLVKAPGNIPIIPVMPDILQFTYLDNNKSGQRFIQQNELRAELCWLLPFNPDDLLIYNHCQTRKKRIKLPALIYGYSQSVSLLDLLNEQNCLSPPGLIPVAIAQKNWVRSVMKQDRVDKCIVDITGTMMRFIALHRDQLIGARVCYRDPDDFVPEIHLSMNHVRQSFPNWSPESIYFSGEDAIIDELEPSGNDGFPRPVHMPIPDHLIRAGLKSRYLCAAGAALAFLADGKKDLTILPIQTRNQSCYIQPVTIGWLILILIGIISVSANLSFRQNKMINQINRIELASESMNEQEDVLKEVNIEGISEIMRDYPKEIISKLLSEIGKYTKTDDIRLYRIQGSSYELILSGSGKSLSEVSRFVRAMNHRFGSRTCDIISSDKVKNGSIHFEVKLIVKSRSD